MDPADEGEIWQFGRAAPSPPHQVVPIAPDRRPVATRKDAVPIARFQRPPGRRRDGPRRMAALVLQLAAAHDPADRRVAGMALHRLGRHRAAALELARRRPRHPGPGVEAGPDDQLRPRPGPIVLTTGSIPRATAAVASGIGAVTP